MPVSAADTCGTRLPSSVAASPFSAAMPLPLPTTNLQYTSTSTGSRGRRSSVDSVATADYHPHLHLGLHEHPQFETISQIRASLADLEKAYSSKPAHTPLSGRIIHVSHYIPFLVRARAEVDYEHREQEREQARSSVAAMAAVARARRAERNAQDRREAVLADMHVKAPEPGLSLGARRASMDTAASRMALHGLDGQDMYALLEENQQRSKQRAGRRAWMAQSAIDHVDSDDNADDGYDPGQDTLKDSFSPIGSPEGVEHVYHSSRHSSVGAAGGAKKVLAPSALARPHLHDEVKACNGIGQAAGVASSPLTASSTSPSSASVSASVSTSAAAAARSYTVGSATAPRQHHDGPFVSDHWILTQRRGHTALNSGVRSLRRTHKQTFIGWPGDVDFAAKAQGDLRTESGHLTEEEKSQIEEALRDLEHWDLSPPTAAADADTSNVSQAAPHASGRSLASADGAVAVQHPKAKTTVAPEPAAALRLHRHFRSAASAAAEERREEYEEEHLDGQVTHGVKYVPVWMGSELAHGFYEGYCKTVLWPLLHYLLWEDVNPVNGAAWDGWAWDAYYEANRAFAQRIAQEYQPGDMVIVHDYHLLLVPKMLRHLCPDAHITLFVHAPFPSSEVFRCLPRRQEILEGMLGADLACFQTFSYSRHFLSSCIRVCGFDASFNAVESLDGQVTSISYNPIGICASNISRDVMSLGVRPKTEAFQRMYSGKKIIVGVDKLDVVRGVLHKLQAFQQLLAAYPEWRGRVVLIQVTTPAAHDSPALEREVSELAAQINSEYGTLAFAPVHHYHQIVDRDEYFALMSVADLSLFTAVRDGMNTTSMEYVISQEQSGKKSPLVLSEFTGTASRIRTALQINPWNTWGVTKAIHQALTMGAEEKEQRHRHAYDLVTLHTSRTWAATLVRQLVYRLHVEETSHLTPELDLEAMQSDRLAAMVGSEPRSSTEPRSGPQCLLLLDYDGTLTPIVRDPEKALPSDRLVAALDKLSADTRNAIFIISGRDQQFLTKHLGHLDNIGFSAEHGSFIKEPGAGEPWINLTKDFDLSWKGDIRAIFEYYTEVCGMPQTAIMAVLT